MLVSKKFLLRFFRHHGKNSDTAKAMREMFRDPGNIIPFAEFCFPHHLTKASPEFHYELIELANSHTNVGIAAPRGFAKSTVVNLVYLAWLIVNKKYHYVLSISDTLAQSTEFVNTLRDELENNVMLRWLYGDLRGYQSWGNGRFITSTGIKVHARGYGMKIRGLKFRQYRPELLLFDDLENDESVQSPDQRDKLRNWFTLAALPALAKGGRAIVIGTILHGDSLLTNIVNKQGVFAGWTTKVYKAINTDPETGKLYSLWPEHYSVADLVAMRDDPMSESYMGSLVFAQEYQNEPIDEKDAIIQRKWIKRAELVPQDIKQRAVFCDPAISKSEAADFFAKIACVVDRLDNLYIYRIGNDRLSFSQGVESIYGWYRDEKPDYIGVESVQFQEAYIDVTKGLPVIELEPDKDKRRRTLAVSRFFEAGQVYIINGITNAEVMIDQLVHFPGVKHDDLVDVVVYAIDKMLVKRFGTYGNRNAAANTQGITASLDERTY